MQISIEEVSRLLAVAPSNTGVHQVNARGGQVSSGRQAAQVDISTSAQEIQLLKRQINSLPDVREQRVAQLKTQVENGTYNVSGVDIADLIIRRTLADSSRL
jgi:negative regulator of flagellin synthesis FlgM